MRTSVAESIPSPTTAKLPANKPIMILDTDRIALPIVLIHEVLISIFSLDIEVTLYNCFVMDWGAKININRSL